MKANRKFVNEEEAVSPVIAVILMVAITVVLAATVFVLVSDLGGDVGQSSPKLSMNTDSSSKSTKWVAKIADATRGAGLSDYEVILSTPTLGTVVFKPNNTWSFNNGQAQEVNATTLWTASSGTLRDSNVATNYLGTTIGVTYTGYRVTFLDISGDDLLNVLDTVTLTYDSDADENDFDNRLPSGTHKIELRHVPTGSIVGSLSNSF